MNPVRDQDFAIFTNGFIKQKVNHDKLYYKIIDGNDF